MFGLVHKILGKFPRLLYQPNVAKVLLTYGKPVKAFIFERRRCLWLHSPTGFGKNHMIRELKERLPEGMRMFEMATSEGMKWCDGYDSEEMIWIDELDKDNKVPVPVLKRICDVQETSQAFKGGFVRIQAMFVVVTSNFSLRECYPNGKDYDALKSRFYEVACPHYEKDADDYCQLTNDTCDHIASLWEHKDDQYINDVKPEPIPEPEPTFSDTEDATMDEECSYAFHHMNRDDSQHSAYSNQHYEDEHYDE